MRSFLPIVIVLTICLSAKAEVCASFASRELAIASAEKLLGSKAEKIIELSSADSGTHYLGVGAECGNTGCSFVIFTHKTSESILYSGRTFFHPDAVQILSDPKIPGLQLLSYVRSNVSQGSLVRLVQDGCAEFKTVAKVDGNSDKLMDFVESTNITSLK